MAALPVDCALYGAGIEALKNVAPVGAVIAAAAIAAIGWIVKEMVSFGARNWNECAHRINLMVALCSQISSNAGAEANYSGDENRDRLLAEFDRPSGRREPFIPYVLTTATPAVTGQLTEQFHLLPESVSPSVQEYLDCSDSLDTQLKDFRSEAFKQIGPARQKGVLADTFKLGTTTMNAGQLAIQRLNQEIKIQRNSQKKKWIALGATGFVASVLVFMVASHWIKTGVRAGEVWASTCSKPSISFVL